MTQRKRCLYIGIALVCAAGLAVSTAYGCRSYARHQQRVQAETHIREALDRMESPDQGANALTSLLSDNFASPLIGDKARLMAVMAEHQRQDNTPEDIDVSKARIAWDADAAVASNIVITFVSGITMRAAFRFQNENGAWRIVSMDVIQE
ncbi:MAG TPA: hypothetical protein PLO62_03500 [Candidatus Hydrogenedentes bacterium]|nr:hypothetical protein [Candidatus Hydrogenedentota bacterium]HOS02087.1 hypothetical protein [Candidatus Hydrogenedentota bacterium]